MVLPRRFPLTAFDLLFAFAALLARGAGASPTGGFLQQNRSQNVTDLSSEETLGAIWQAGRCTWRQTGACSAKGPREAWKDQACVVTLQPGWSGFCDCNGDGVLNNREVAYGCVNKSFATCAEACGLQAGQCAWRQTGGCSGTGPREPWEDQTCDVTLQPGWSGFCDCNRDGVLNNREVAYGCVNKPFATCTDACRLQAIRTTTTTTTARPCAWRQTGACSGTGPREPWKDQTCDVAIKPGWSGFCDCNEDGVLNSWEVAYSCVTKPFATCADACKLQAKRCAWRQTGACSGTGPREPSKDKTCDVAITPGWSGFCDCNGDGVVNSREVAYGCGNKPFATCADACRLQVTPTTTDTTTTTTTVTPTTTTSTTTGMTTTTTTVPPAYPVNGTKETILP